MILVLKTLHNSTSANRIIHSLALVKIHAHPNTHTLHRKGKGLMKYPIFIEDRL